MPAIGPMDPSLVSSIGLQGTKTENKSGGPGELFQQLLSKTNGEQIAADTAIRDFVEGKPGTSVQEVVMAVAQAEMSFQFFMEVRNHLIDSYTELMRMQF